MTNFLIKYFAYAAWIAVMPNLGIAGGVDVNLKMKEAPIGSRWVGIEIGEKDATAAELLDLREGTQLLNLEDAKCSNLQEPYFLLIETSQFFPEETAGSIDPFDPLIYGRIMKEMLEASSWLQSKPSELREKFQGVVFTSSEMWRLRPAASKPDIVDNIRNLPLGSPGMNKYVEFLRSRYEDIGTFNRFYKSSATAFDAICSQNFIKTNDENPFVKSNDGEFLYQVASHYLGMVSNIINEVFGKGKFYGEMTKVGGIQIDLISVFRKNTAGHFLVIEAPKIEGSINAAKFYSLVFANDLKLIQPKDSQSELDDYLNFWRKLGSAAPLFLHWQELPSVYLTK